MLDALELTELVSTITGLSAVGSAAILAQTGDPTRFGCPRTWVKHAGLTNVPMHDTSFPESELERGQMLQTVIRLHLFGGPPSPL